MTLEHDYLDGKIKVGEVTYDTSAPLVLFADHPLYAAARARAEDVAAEQKAKYEARRASWNLAAV
jgi:hypothetical protein